MTESVRSVNILVRIDFKGHDVGNKSIEEALHNMNYEFSYDDNYIRIIDTEIVDTFVPSKENLMN